nr:MULTISPECIES: caspase family protein [unclassified Tardiphaga]
MARGISLHLGLNAIDPTHYAGWDGALNACEADAESMKEIAEACGYQARIALTTEAKRDTVISFLSKDAQQLQSGDIFLLTYSGHGGRLPDINGDEPDGQDETWCLYDGQLIDDEIYQLYRGLSAGVRGFVLSDSCHSGTMLKSMFYMAALASGWVGDPTAPSASPPKYKFMPPPIASRTYKNNRVLRRSAADGRCLLQRSQRYTRDRSPDLGLSGQPVFARRHLQQRVHRKAPAGLEPRQIRRRLRRLPSGGPEGAAAEPIPQPYGHRQGNAGIRSSAAL